MRLTTPRITPIEAADWDAEQRALMAGFEKRMNPTNVLRTFIRHPDLVRRWLPFAYHTLSDSTLPAHERELVILRIAWTARCEYEWGQHVVIGGAAGVTEEEFERVSAGPDAEGWTDLEAALLRAVDEMEADSMILDGTWETLARHYDEKQLTDLLFTVGHYRMLAGAMNSLGVQLDDGLPGFSE